MDQPCSREEMRGCLRDLEKLNRWFLGYRPVLRWLDSLDVGKSREPLQILDVGCGGGDLLRQIEGWANRQGVRVKLTGCDVNRDVIAIAAEASEGMDCAEWIAADVFSLNGYLPVDVVVSSLFTHHLSEDGVVRFVRWMEEHAQVGWFINDLSRAPIPYWLIKVFAKAARLHRFVQHDAPVSFRRAFVANDWRRLCTEAGLSETDFAIEAWQPARLCVSRRTR